MAETERFECHYLERETPEYFSLIRSLWIKAADKNELVKIRADFGVERISNALNFKNPIGVKAATAVLLYLSITEGYADFFSDIFIDNALAAMKNEDNAFLIVRLIRLLQTYKSFSDWILTRGDTAKDNILWERVNEFSSSQDEELKKESILAVKEGTRQGALPDQWCIIPDHIVEKLRADIIWKIAGIEDETLEELGKGSIEGTRGDEEISRLEQINRQLRLEGNRRITAAENQLQEQNNENEKLQNEINQIYRTIQTIGGSGGLEPMSDMGPDNMKGLRKALSSLTSEVSNLRKGDTNLRKQVQEGSKNVRIIRTENKMNDTETFRVDVTSSLSASLAALQNTLQVASVTGTDPSADGRSGQGDSVVREPAWAPLADTAPAAELLPGGWDRKLDARTNHFYYINKASGRVQWNSPVE